MQNESQIVLYQPDDSIRLEVKIDAGNETVWLTQQQIAELFGTKRPAITKHLSNIYKSGELDKASTCSILEHMGNDGKQHYTTSYYNIWQKPARESTTVFLSSMMKSITSELPSTNLASVFSPSPAYRWTRK